MTLPDALRAMLIAVAPLLPNVEAAELIPEVDMIQVDILGTVNIQMAPMINTMITVPKDNIPLLANQANLVKSAEAPSVPTNNWYLLISD